jgi:hypothetical protein
MNIPMAGARTNDLSASRATVPAVTRLLAFAISAAGLAAGCAAATDTNGAIGDASTTKLDAPTTRFDAPTTKFDAPMKHDAPTKLDAPHEIDAAPPPVDAGPATTCATSLTCATATVLAGIGGDELGASTSSASGYQAAWYSIRVSETDNGPIADPMSMQATLTSPAGTAFDLLVYVPNNATSTDCSTATATVSTSGSNETWSLAWGELGLFANGIDDSRTVAIEIIPHSGDSCSPNATWSLAIETGFY